MKKTICLLFFISFFCISEAQLVVSNTGKVGVGICDSIVPLSTLSVGHAGYARNGMTIEMTSVDTHTHTDWCNIYSHVHAQANPQWQFCFYGNTEGVAASSRLVCVSGKTYKPAASSSGRSYGVMGVAGMSTPGWNYGVSGFLKTSTDVGAGVYGGLTYGTESSVPGRYAGYFSGQTKVNGDFYATAMHTTSDARLKTNIADVKMETLQKVQNLHAIQFSWQKIIDKHTEDTATVKQYYFSEDMDYQRSHYGFLAQEVQKLFPELVHADDEGYLSVNYVELIPLLVQSIQELSAEVEALKKNDMARMPQKKDADQAVLFQNSPNPFSIDTKIDYQLPQTTQEANLYIYNMNGLQVAEYPVSCFGNGSIIVSAGTLDAGMYLYSLIADGQVVDTKRMILTK